MTVEEVLELDRKMRENKRKAGLARAKKLTAKQRSKIGRKGADKRWSSR